jgi:hypothetical protein
LDLALDAISDQHGRGGYRYSDVYFHTIPPKSRTCEISLGGALAALAGIDRSDTVDAWSFDPASAKCFTALRLMQDEGRVYLDQKGKLVATTLYNSRRVTLDQYGYHAQLRTPANYPRLKTWVNAWSDVLKNMRKAGI